MAQQLRDLEAKVSAGDGRSGDLGNSSDFVMKRGKIKYINDLDQSMKCNRCSNKIK